MNEDIERPDPWVDRLSDYVDDDLSDPERREIERHLTTCVECRAIVDDLRRVVMMAGELDKEVALRRDLWPGISGRLVPRRPRKPLALWLRTGWLRPQFAVAVIVICCVAALWFVLRPRSPEQRTTARVTAPLSSSDADREYEKTVARLQREAETRLSLDPRVVEVLNDNLATLDAAIATYRDALAAEPGNQQLRSRLTAARHTKLQVLQQAVALASEGGE